jgi:hypothetical protein
MVFWTAGQNRKVCALFRPIVCAQDRAPTQTMTSVKTHSLCVPFRINGLSIA